MAAPSPLAVLYSSRTLRPTLPPKQSSDYQVEVGGEIRLAGRCRARARAHYQQATSGQHCQIPAGQVPQPPPDLIPHYSRAYGPAHNKTDQRPVPGFRRYQQVPGYQRPAGPAAAPGRRLEVRPPPHPRRCGKHCPCRYPRASSDADASAALPAPGRENGPASTGAHAQPEAMRLRPTAVVRLERTLAHWDSRWRQVCLLRSDRCSRQRHEAQSDRNEAALKPRRGYRTNTRYAPARDVVKRAGLPVTGVANPAEPGLAPGGQIPIACSATKFHPTPRRTARFPERTVNYGPRLWTSGRRRLVRHQRRRPPVERMGGRRPRGTS